MRNRAFRHSFISRDGGPPEFKSADVFTAESMPVASARIESNDLASYYPPARKVWVKLIAERETHKLVGAQVVGYGEAAKRVDVAATAITSGMKVEEFAQLDLAYSPPYFGTPC